MNVRVVIQNLFFISYPVPDMTLNDCSFMEHRFRNSSLIDNQVTRLSASSRRHIVPVLTTVLKSLYIYHN